MKELFIEYVLPVLITGIAAILALGLKALAKKLEADAGSSKFSAAAAKVVHFTATVAQDLEVELREPMRAASKDGKITPEEAARLRHLALGRVRALLTQRGMDEVRAALGLQAAGALDTYLSGVLERVVATMPGKAPVEARNGVPSPLVGPGGLPVAPPSPSTP